MGAVPCWSGYWGAVPLAIGVIALYLQVATGFLGWGIGAGGGYQARGVVDSGTGLSSRPATAIQGEGAAYWTRRVSGYTTRRSLRLRSSGPLHQPKNPSAERGGALGLALRARTVALRSVVGGLQRLLCEAVR